VSAENVAIVKSSWAGWRQSLHEQMVRDFEAGVEESIEAWDEATGRPTLQPLEFIDGGDVVLVCAVAVGDEKSFWFNYTMDGPRIAGWEAFDDEAEARKAAGLSS
jgi:hypothetical protein